MKGNITIVSFVIIIVGVATTVFILYKTARERTPISITEQEIQSLQEEEIRIERQNSDAREQNLFFASDLFKERELKETGRYQKEGEKVIVVTQASRLEEETVQEIVQVEVEIVPLYEKWWQQFFGYE